MSPFCYDYPRPAYSVDAVIISQSEQKILLIKRKYNPFAGKWAFPGGFMDMNETPEEAIIRELEEETGLKNIALQQFKTYGAVNRDPRGRIISTIFIGYIDKTIEYEVYGMDDAEKAAWFTISEIPELAFDHESIIREILNT